MSKLAVNGCQSSTTKTDTPNVQAASNWKIFYCLSIKMMPLSGHPAIMSPACLGRLTRLDLPKMLRKCLVRARTRKQSELSDHRDACREEIRQQSEMENRTNFRGDKIAPRPKDTE